MTLLDCTHILSLLFRGCGMIHLDLFVSVGKGCDVEIYSHVDCVLSLPSFYVIFIITLLI